MEIKARSSNKNSKKNLINSNEEKIVNENFGNDEVNKKDLIILQI
jgi:hypothetical protein